MTRFAARRISAHSSSKRQSSLATGVGRTRDRGVGHGSNLIGIAPQLLDCVTLRLAICKPETTSTPVLFFSRQEEALSVLPSRGPPIPILPLSGTGEPCPSTHNSSA